MPRKTAPLLPATSELLRQFGERLRVARLRRRLSAKQVAERAGMNPMTLRSLERGGAGVTIGAYLAVMQVLGIEKELDHLAQADPIGRSLQDARLIKLAQPGWFSAIGEAMTGRQPQASRSSSEPRELPATPVRSVKKTRAAGDSRQRHGEGTVVSSRELARLLDDPSAPSSGQSKTRSKTKSKTPTKTQTKPGSPSSRARRR
jgi:transcriptional regulator with XRE-family HTH domain